MINFGVAVILPAAGSGERVGFSIPKQYCKILGKPLFLFALQEFNQLCWIKKIVLVVDSPDQARELLLEYGVNSEKILVVRGEHTRHRSIRAGVSALHKSENNIKVVIVHDAVRPLVSSTLVEELVLAAEEHGAAGATRPLVSTVLSSNSDGFLEQSLERWKHVASETPQAFQFGILTTAYSKCSDEDLDTGTECLQLALVYAGVKARLLPGTEDLWKVTYKKDIYAAIGCLREHMNRVCIIAPDDNSAVQLLTETLSSKVSKVQHVTNSGDTSRFLSKETFNTVIFFHLHEIDQDNLLDFATMFDINKQGLIVHVIEHTNADGMQSMSVYDLHCSGRNMAHHYEKLHKGVVVIHRLTAGEDSQLADLVSTLVLSEASTFSGQTLFL